VRILPRVVGVLLIAFAGATRAPLAASEHDDATFKSRVDLVALSVTVTNKADKQVGGLQASDFVIQEDGVRQSVAYFSTTSMPLDLAILMDASASMAGKIELARDAATGLVTSLRAGDRASVVEFRDVVRVRQPLTSDLNAVATALRQIAPRGSTSMYDALYITLRDLGKADHDPQQVRRQVIVLLSDGDDTASLMAYEDVLDLARREGVVVFAVSLKTSAEIERERLVDGNGRRVMTEGDFGLKSLTQDTGGRAFFPNAATELRPIYDSIAEELGHEYAIGYVPTNLRRDGAWRRISVQVLAGDARPRTRTGYFATGDPTGSGGGTTQQ
jgi:Ca-activated chloride channel family protein